MSLEAEQAETLGAPRLRYGLLARLLFLGMALVYGRKRTLSRFKVLEIIARVPYQAWEQVAYVAMTHTYARPGFARRVYEFVKEARALQDNEQWHMLILEDLIQRSGERESFLLHRVAPQLAAFAYYHASWLLYAVHPRHSYALNADLEDHAEHEYMEFVREHPEFETRPFESDFAKDYGGHANWADLFRRIALDEREHKLESLARIKAPRFS